MSLTFGAERGCYLVAAVSAVLSAIIDNQTWKPGGTAGSLELLELVALLVEQSDEAIWA